MNTEYRDVENELGFRVGDDGSIWSQWLKEYKSQPWKDRFLGSKWFKQELWVGPKGYQAIYLRTPYVRRQVHEIVLTTFVGSCPEGLEGCHKNGNPADNRLENLRWGTRKSNIIDSMDHETHNILSELSIDDIIEIRKLKKDGMTSSDIADKFFYSVTTINRIVRGTKHYTLF